MVDDVAGEVEPDFGAAHLRGLLDHHLLDAGVDREGVEDLPRYGVRAVRHFPGSALDALRQHAVEVRPGAHRQHGLGRSPSAQARAGRARHR